MAAGKTFIKKDLLTILALAIGLSVIIGIVFALDSSNNAVGTWAASFYDMLLG